MGKTYKDGKGHKWPNRMDNNRPSRYKEIERSKRRAEAKDCLRKNKEPDKTYIYSEYYW